jgi:hypothetical protein
MATLLANNTEIGINRVELLKGINTVGRAEGNLHIINDASVSSRHCEIVVNDGTISARDLGSTNGTFLDDQPIQQATLVHGQRLKLGRIEFVVEAPEAVPPTNSAPLRVSVVSKAPVVHASTAPPIAVGRTAAEAIAAIQPVVHEERSFYRQIPGTLAYPFNKSGSIMLIIGSILFVVLEFLGGFSFYLKIVGIGYLFAFMQKIISHSAQGEDELPPWPELTDFISDILLPCLMLAGVFVVSLAPGLLLLFFGRENPMLAAMAIPALIIGALYFPMALLAVAVSDNFLALSPHIVLPSMIKVFVPYSVTFVVLAVLASVRVGAGLAAAFVPVEEVPWNIAVTLVMGFVSLYVLTVEMRVLGLMFRSYRNRLGWLG